jgi:cobalt-zinc-cadmium efflux system membrane fusion protein
MQSKPSVKPVRCAYPWRVSCAAWALVAALTAPWAGARPADAAAPAGAPAPSAGGAPPAPVSFKPTREQLAGLGVATVTRARFRAERMTDGKIALNGDHTTPVFSPYSGRVVEVHAGPGDTVRKGEPLLTVQASEFVQGQSDLLAAQAAVASAHAQLTLAQAVEKRKHALLDARAGSLQDWQQSQSDLAAAQGNARTAEAALAAVRNRLAILGKSEAQIDALARGEKMDALADVLAPISGTVIDRQVGPGQYLQAAGATPVYTVADLSTVWLVANVRETDAPFVHKGQTAEVHVLALPDRVFTARVSSVAPGLDPATRRLNVRAEIANPEGLLRPEMFASFSLIAGAADDALAVPEAGVIYEGTEARVWIVGDDGTLALRRIRPGRSAHGLLEVVEGVKAGEKVVTSGALFIDRAAQGD